MSTPPPSSRWIEHSTCQHREYYMKCDEFERLLERADGRCEVCGIASAETTKRRLTIDHDHDLGSGWNHVRGMLCTRCNAAIAKVDAASVAASPEQQSYLNNAWHLTNRPGEGGERKKMVFNFRMQPSWMEQFVKIADAQGESASAVIRALIADDVRRHRHLLKDQEPEVTARRGTPEPPQQTTDPRSIE